MKNIAFVLSLASFLSCFSFCVCCQAVRSEGIHPATSSSASVQAASPKPQEKPSTPQPTSSLRLGTSSPEVPRPSSLAVPEPLLPRSKPSSPATESTPLGTKPTEPQPLDPEPLLSNLRSHDESLREINRSLYTPRCQTDTPALILSLFLAGAICLNAALLYLLSPKHMGGGHHSPPPVENKP
jgi:hypothetical protein